MIGAGDVVPFTPEELAQACAVAEEARRDFGKWIEQLQTPEAKAEGAILAQEAMETWGSFEREIAAGKYTLSPAELDQLRRDAEAFAEEVRTGKCEVSHHKKADPLSDRRAVLEYRGLRVLRWIEQRGVVFYPGKLKRETAKRYLRDMPVVFPELVGELSRFTCIGRVNRQRSAYGKVMQLSGRT